MDRAGETRQGGKRSAGDRPRAGSGEEALVFQVQQHFLRCFLRGEVGGVDQFRANPSAIYVVRGSNKDNPQIFHLNAEYATGMLLAERFEMQAQDVVFVDTAGVSKWNRVISQLLPTISVIGIADSISSSN